MPEIKASELISRTSYLTKQRDAALEDSVAHFVQLAAAGMEIQALQKGIVELKEEIAELKGETPEPDLKTVGKNDG